MSIEKVNGLADSSVMGRASSLGRFRAKIAVDCAGSFWTLGRLQLLAMTQKIKEEFYVERHAYTWVVLYEITADDLDQLEAASLSVSEDFSFALAALAIAVSFSIALSTTKIESSKTFDVFWLITLLGYLSSVFFGIRWFRGRRDVKRVAKRIREREGPLGQEGKEIGPSELASLTPQPEPTGQTGRRQ